MRDPYQVLGVAKGADIKAVKKAYRKLAREFHPDLHPGDTQAETRFKEVAAAYDFLSDAEQKAKYDRGEIDASGTPKAERRFYRTYAEGDTGTRYHDPREFFRDFQDADIFAEVFGGARAARARGTDIRATLEIGFLDAVNGAVKEITLPDGKRVKLTIPPGSEDGQVLRLKGQGGPGMGDGPAGDVNIELKVKPHPVFRRDGRDIHSEVPVTLAEAVLGGKVDVGTVDGTVSLSVPKGANSGTRLRLRGKGVPAGGGDRGDHYVTLKVVLPERPDPELSQFVEAWSARHPYSVRDRQ
ncbi:MAG: J domain-containing protein [Rhodospirillales bacterium]|nr:MAG: J domain-containing protein [Rhodospirillales bacterium]